MEYIDNNHGHYQSKPYFNLEAYTVKFLLVAAATIHFRYFFLRLQFKGGLYLRAATIKTFQKLT